VARIGSTHKPEPFQSSPPARTATNRQTRRGRAHGTKLYYFHRSTDGQFAVIRTESRQRQGARASSAHAIFAHRISAPYGEHIIVTSENPDKSTSLLLVPTRGGQPTELVRVEAPRRASFKAGREIVERFS
jgi:hypothetical protein